jgi:hypothetical protein
MGKLKKFCIIVQREVNAEMILGALRTKWGCTIHSHYAGMIFSFSLKFTAMGDGFGVNHEFLKPFIVKLITYSI